MPIREHAPGNDEGFFGMYCISQYSTVQYRFHDLPEF
jgi:hypothetical protein